MGAALSPRKRWLTGFVISTLIIRNLPRLPARISLLRGGGMRCVVPWTADEELKFAFFGHVKQFRA